MIDVITPDSVYDHHIERFLITYIYIIFSNCKFQLSEAKTQGNVNIEI